MECNSMKLGFQIQARTAGEYYQYFVNGQSGLSYSLSHFAIQKYAKVMSANVGVSMKTVQKTLTVHELY